MSAAAARAAARNINLPTRSLTVKPNIGSRALTAVTGAAGAVAGATGRGVRSLGENIRGLTKPNARVAGDAMTANPVSKQAIDAGKGTQVVGNAKTAKKATQADATRVVDDAVPDTPEGTKLKNDADALAKDPNVSKTLQKWGIRGGVGVIFLMMIYDTANPFEAIAKGADDTKEGVKGAADLTSGIFEAFKGLLSFFTKNWMVSGLSSLCCVLLILLPMMMRSGGGMAPRRPMYY